MPASASTSNPRTQLNRSSLVTSSIGDGLTAGRDPPRHAFAPRQAHLADLGAVQAVGGLERQAPAVAVGEVERADLDAHRGGRALDDGPHQLVPVTRQRRDLGDVVEEGELAQSIAGLVQVGDGRRRRSWMVRSRRDHRASERWIGEPHGPAFVHGRHGHPSMPLAGPGDHASCMTSPAMPDPIRTRARSTYDAAADRYDDAALGFWSRSGERTIERLGLTPGMTVLDLACGSGASTLPAARRVGPTGHVIGIDLSERMLEMGRDKARFARARRTSTSGRAT